jgi:hypothetical protein
VKDFSTIKFLIAIFFLLRLYGITNPPLEANHNWRQCTTNMYARNFLEVDNNPLYCRVDMAGDLTGITAKEFPLFNYTIYLTAKVCGWQHWYGRLISLVVSSFGVWFFYLLVKKYFDESTQVLRQHPIPLAFPATLLLLCSIWFGHSRIIMPDTFSVSLVLMGLWFGLEWLQQGKVWRLVLFGLLATLGALSKLPSGFLLAALAFPVFDKIILQKRKAGLVVMSILPLACCGWWYFQWLPHVIATYGYEQYPMRSVSTGMLEILHGIPKVLERFYQSAMKSYVGFALYLAGLVLLVWRKEWRFLSLFGLLSAVFVGYMFKSGASFYHHNYYIIPFLPVMAVVAGFALAQIPRPWLRHLLLVAVAVEGIANQQDAFRIKKTELPKLELESIADSLSQRQDLVAFYYPDGNPQELYFAHRKGWVVNAAEANDPTYLPNIARRGCNLFFINKKYWENRPRPPFELVFENDNYLVFKLLP